MEDTASPRVLKKIVYAGSTAASFGEGSRHLAKLAELAISPERVRRACHRAGGDRIEHHRRMEEAYLAKPLPERSHALPAEAEAPEVACVMADGGRWQMLDRSLPAAGRRSARKGEHWKESRIGLLAGVSSQRREADPQPALPPELRYQAMADTLAEIGKTGAKLDEPDEQADDDLFAPQDSDGLVGAQLQRRGVVASRRSWEEFGPLLASRAWCSGFAAAERQVFLSDGSAAIEKMQQRCFSHYTSVLDILHALSYSLAASAGR